MSAVRAAARTGAREGPPGVPGRGGTVWGGDVATLVGMGAATLAGGIHLAVVPEHVTESWLFGAFFLGLGVGQLGLVGLLRHAMSARLVLAAIWAHVAVVMLYVASRTADLPFLPPHDVGHSVKHLPVAGGIGNGIPIYPGTRIEPVGALDVTCLLAELALITVLTARLDPVRRTRTTSWMFGIATTAVLLRVLVLPWTWA